MAFWFGSSTLSIEDFTASPGHTSERPSTRMPVSPSSPASNQTSVGQDKTVGAKKSGFALGLATPGARVCVTAVNGANPALEKRLEAMGIRVGSALEVLQHEAGSVIVRIGTTRLALGASMAHRLHVASVDLH